MLIDEIVLLCLKDYTIEIEMSYFIRRYFMNIASKRYGSPPDVAFTL
jgi:hypothetical protein